MKATIDREGRIPLTDEFQKQLGVQPGDEVVLEPRGSELVIKAAHAKAGLCYEGNVLVHRGTCTPRSDVLETDRDERMDHLCQGLPQ
jgi:bifunctional DNA-binding transcriptional regulator/antitoxin component of YhaV-PrlF toxin-antitoxin module